MHKDENGYIVVETIFSFMLFTFLIISILSLINIVTLQTRVHYALTQTALELSMYSYVIDALGLSEHIMALDETAQEVQQEVDSVLGDIETIQSGLTSEPMSATEFFDNLDAVTNGIGSLGETMESALEDPKETLVKILRYGIDSAKNYAMQEFFMKPIFIKKYLANGNQSADVYLESFGVDGGLKNFNLEKSTYIDSSGDITIVASYEIDYTFGVLPLPFAKIKVEQTAKTKAWLGGVKNE